MSEIIHINLSRWTRNPTSQRYRRASKTDEQHEARNEVESNRWNGNQRPRNVAFNPYRAAFNYNVENDYSSQQIVAIKSMNFVCKYCKAYKFKNEAPGFCCPSGQVKLTSLAPSPEPLHSLVFGNGSDYKQLFSNDVIFLYNKSYSRKCYANFQDSRSNISFNRFSIANAE